MLKRYISFIFDYLIFPITCVYYNQLTFQSKLVGIFFKTLYFSVPMTIIETWLEKNTQLVQYKKSWKWVHSFLSLTGTFLLVRFTMMLIRWKSSENEKKQLTS
ncbi:CBO0543 family protein [Alkalihalobacterium alkalinitrilicum]|uniref:CBO0543 family protein n=1 Tax=Alkalihalobacterium alkalinitrilicum TaxID=427920 RepID=UPI003B75C65C